MRSKKIPTRTTQKDPIYDSTLVTRFINGTMRDGKKSLARRQVYKAMGIIAEQSKKDGLECLTEAVDNVKPTIEVRSRRVGGASYQVPTPIRPERRDTLAVRWILNAARARSNSTYHTFADKLAAEILEAHEGLGAAVKKKLDTHKMAEANKAFAHFRW